MNTDDLQRNIDSAIEMVAELAQFVQQSEQARPAERQLFKQAINSLQRRLRFVNDSFEDILNGVTLTKGLPGQSARKQPITQVQTARKDILIRVRDRESFLKELNITESVIKRLRKKRLLDTKKKKQYRKPHFYGKLSNKIFLGMAETWVRRGTFKSLSLDLRRSNMNILTTTYVSMMFFSILLSFVAGILLFIFLLFFEVGLDVPFVSAYSGNYLIRVLKVFWVILAAPLLMGLSFYFFPGAEKRSLAKRIDQELPFVVIHMASVSGSGIEPTEIFKIIGLSNEYKYTKTEIAKILNQTNVYGYDLTNALRNVALATPSTKLAELLNGISITINSGGDIKAFFEKRAESLLLEYRLEREKFTKTAETFMDIYISIVIAAPMILLMLLVMISVSGIQTGFSVTQMTITIIGIVAIINILFLTFLKFKQPTY